MKAFWLATFAPILVAGAAGARFPSVTIRNGTYSGVYISSFEQDHFLGMPFAQPPIPRFHLPLSLNTSWRGARKAVKYSSICVGYPSGGVYDDIGYEQSEDCLTLNVVRPSGVQQGSNVPVVVWIHGGGFSMGGSADLRYNGSWIVDRSVEMKKPIIFVSVNYRLNAFGFIYSKEVRSEGTGNFGLHDQRMALRWIHENIGDFGGDPTKVTLMGESAGSVSVSLQLLFNSEHPTHTDLFRGAIMESGSAVGNAYKSADEYQPSYDAVVSMTGCSSASSSLDCLRSLDLSTFIAATNRTEYNWIPVVDNVFLKDYPSRLLSKGQLARVPILLGQNTDEGTSFGKKNLNTTADLVAALQAFYPKLSNNTITTLLEIYPDDPLLGCPYNTGDAYLTSGRQDKRSNAIWGDTRMHAGRRLVAHTMAKYKPVYTYRFDQPPQNGTIDYGTGHFQEVAYVFSNPLPTQNPLGRRAGDAELAKAMTSAWVLFVHNQDPHYKGESFKWPNYQHKAQNVVFRRHGNFIEDDDYRKDGITLINNVAKEFQR